LKNQLVAMNNRAKPDPLVTRMLDGINQIRALVKNENGPVPQDDIRKIHGICAELVRLSSLRPGELPP